MSGEIELEQWQDYLEAALPNHGDQPLIVRVFRETSSTQELAKSFAPHRAIVIANHQHAGRGRMGRHWLSQPGTSVLMSVCWPIDCVRTTHDQVSLLAGVALARAIHEIAPDATIRLKWPNDVLVDNRKLAGILIEATQQTFIIGIGINATQQACPDESLRPHVISLEELGYAADRLAVIESVYCQIDRALSSMNLKQTLDEWRAYATLGQRQTFEHNNRQVTGQVIDLDPDHGLIVRRDSGEIITLPAATTSVVK